MPVVGSREYHQQWRDSNRERYRQSKRSSNHKAKGWLAGEHEKAEARRALVVACDCCGSPDPRHIRGWKADHDHTTGLFRGFLCHACNVRLGPAEKYNLKLSSVEISYLRGVSCLQ